MKTIRRLIFGEIIHSVAFVTLCFLALFFFFDFVEEIGQVSRGSANSYELRHAFLYVVMLIPTRVYELLPITVLIGSIFVMARLAHSSEYTILRTSGLGPWRALRMLMGLGLGFAVLTFVTGDYIAPPVDRAAQLMKARFSGSLSVGQTGAWLKDKQDYSQYAVNVASLTGDGEMKGIRIFEFDNKGYLRSSLYAQTGKFGADDAWILGQVERSEFPLPTSAAEPSPSIALQLHKADEFIWPSTLSAEMVSTALLRPDRMKTVDLFQYVRHLQSNAQSAQRYEIAFWRKVFYPMSCLVMVILALPFAYLHVRSGGVTGYIFAGVMIGISFFLMNNVFGFIGNLHNWEPWVAAGSPGVLYLLISLTAFGWLVLRR